jgi:hypothetical protein
MRVRVALMLAVVGSACSASPPAVEVVRGINGAWEAYPPRAEGLGSGAAATRPGPAPVPDPPLKPEYMAEWKAERDQNAQRTREGRPPATSGMACLPEGMPGMMQATFPMEVLETPGQVTIIQEAFNQVRRIYLGQPMPKPEDAEPRFGGHSTGRWDGGTLVVETVAVKDYVRFRNTPHSMAMRITERMRLVDDDFLENQITIDDPEYLTGPWTWTWMYRRWLDYRIEEYVCEDNRYYEDPELRYQRLRVK